MKTDTETMVAALRILSRDIQSDDGVANACISEAADLIERLQTENAELKLAKAELVGVLAGVKDRLDYLIDLWGNEGVTNRVVQSINAAITKHGV